jgi:hypothetical protein
MNMVSEFSSIWATMSRDDGWHSKPSQKGWKGIRNEVLAIVSGAEKMEGT